MKSRISRLQKVKQGNFATPPEEGRKIVPLDALIEDPKNERKVFRNMDGLIATVKAVGIIEPLTVVPHGNGKYMITTGHRRYRAAKAAGLPDITVIVSGGEHEAVRRRKSVVSNVQREDIGPIEMAEGLQALLDEDKTIASQQDLARAIGKDKTWVSRMLRILDLPVDLQQKVATSQLSISYDAIANIARLQSKKDQTRLIDALLDGATNREIRKQIDTLKGKPSLPEANSKKPKIVHHTNHGFTIILQSDTTDPIDRKNQIAGFKQILQRLKKSD